MKGFFLKIFVRTVTYCKNSRNIKSQDVSCAFGNKNQILQRRNAHEMALSNVAPKEKSSHVWTWMFTQSPTLGNALKDKHAVIEKDKEILRKQRYNYVIFLTSYLILVYDI